MDWLFSGKSKKKDNRDSVSDSQLIYLRDEFVRLCIVDADIQSLVALPTAVDQNEWLATNTIGFVEHLNLFCGVLSEYCSASACPNMLLPGNSTASWIDDKGKKIKCSAVQYMNFALSYSQRCCSDESLFPTKYDKSFPVTITTILKKIYRSLLNILAHICYSHYEQLALLQLSGHLNTLTHHFLVFAKTFQLVDEKELGLLGDIFLKLKQFYVFRRNELKIVSSCQFHDGDAGKMDGHDENLSSEIKENETDNLQRQIEFEISTITI